MLFLHGGPGMPMMYLDHAFARELERHFIVVEWDRLAAGKSYHEGIPVSAMRVTREIADAHELIELLCARFGKKKVYLVGHSYGSYLGMLVAARYPNLIAAYVGVGQATDPHQAHEVQDRFFRRKAEASGNRRLLDELDHHKPIDREHWLFEYHAELYHSTSWLPLLWTGLLAPEYRLTDTLNIPRGVKFTHKHLKYDAIDGPLTEDVRALDVPVYFFLGRHDYTTPSKLAVAYLKKLKAPRKQVIWFQDSAHFPFLEEPRKFAVKMLQVHQQTNGGLTTQSSGCATRPADLGCYF
ncbi:MAG: alpha/beta hydrolase [Lysobacterales bacterium]